VASTSDVLFKVGSATGVVSRVVSSTIDSTVLVVTIPGTAKLGREMAEGVGGP
jgi:hypothetical protein